MRITFTQSGGLVGAVRGCTVDTAALPTAERLEVEKLVAASGFAVSQELVAEGSRDRRSYQITIERGPEAFTVVCDDASLPVEARPLVTLLVSRSRPEPPPRGAGVA